MPKPRPLEVDPLRGTSYRTLRALGAGGMGEVFEAEHTGLGHRVVVKLLRTSLRDDPRLIDRFHTEARVLGALDGHPHIVSVRDYGVTPEGRPFLAMERLQGRPLDEAYRDTGPFVPAVAVHVVRQIGLALAAAHRRGIVHRDIKLANVFLCEGSPGAAQVKVLDFGIAKVLGKLPSGALPAYATEDGAVLGTPRYLSPEQVRGKAVDARADIYGLGIVLYMLLAGRGPFDHLRSAAELVRAHLSDCPLPPSRLAEQPIPPALDAVVLRALEKRAEDRYPTAEAFVEALDASLVADEDVERRTLVWSGAQHTHEARESLDPRDSLGRRVALVGTLALVSMAGFLALFATVARALGVF